MFSRPGSSLKTPTVSSDLVHGLTHILPWTGVAVVPVLPAVSAMLAKLCFLSALVQKVMVEVKQIKD